MLTKIAPMEAKSLVDAGAAVIIDIRDTDEYLERSIPGSFSIPMSILEQSPLPATSTLIFTCSSGNRSTRFSPDLLRKAGSIPAMQLDGGVLGYAQAGLAVNQGKATISIFRQIQIVAGGLILLGVFASYFWHPAFLLTAFVGAGLTFAGISGICGLRMVLAKMPWNTSIPIG